MPSLKVDHEEERLTDGYQEIQINVLPISLSKQHIKCLRYEKALLSGINMVFSKILGWGSED